MITLCRQQTITCGFDIESSFSSVQHSTLISSNVQRDTITTKILISYSEYLSVK